MKIILKSAFLILSVFIFTNCASIFSSTSYPVQLNSAPNQATVTITDNNGVEVFKNTTPVTATLKSSVGFFKKARYTVVFSKSGYDSQTYQISASLDGWYFGNLLFGGVIGMLIVDPATGAMYKLDTEFISGGLTKLESTTSNSSINIYDYQEIPVNWKNHLVKITD